MIISNMIQPDFPFPIFLIDPGIRRMTNERNLSVSVLSS
jgi:hypothetical protein